MERLGSDLNNYNVTVITDLGIYNYKNVIAYNEKQAKNLAASDLMWMRREVLISNATFVKVENEESNNG